MRWEVFGLAGFSIPSLSTHRSTAILTDGKRMEFLIMKHTSKEVTLYQILVNGISLFATDATGKKLRKDADNVKAILTQDESFKNALAYNIYAQKVVFRKDLPWRPCDNPEDGSELTEEDLDRLWEYISKKYDLRIEDGHLQKGVNLSAYENKFHPIKEYLEYCASLYTQKCGEWNGDNNCRSEIFIKHLGAEDNTFNREIGTLVLDTLVQRIMIPGCRFDFFPVLHSFEQGIGKTELLRILGRRKWYNDVRTIEGNAAIEAIKDCWVCEIGELGGILKSSDETFKNLITAQSDFSRLAYQKTPKEYKRQCVLIGTTNLNQFLRDTQNRRYAIVECKKKMDFAECEQDVPLYLGEAFLRYKKEGERKLDLSDQSKAIAKEINLKYSVSTEAEEALIEWLNTPVRADIWDCGMHIPVECVPEHMQAVMRDRVSWEEIWKFFGLETPDQGKAPHNVMQQRNKMQKSIEKAMERHGWERRNTTYGKRCKKGRGWVKLR